MSLSEITSPELEQWLSGATDGVESLRSGQSWLRSVAQSAADAEDSPVCELAGVLIQLLEIAASQSGTEGDHASDELKEFLRSQIRQLAESIELAESNFDAQAVVRHCRDRWGDCLSLFDDAAAACFSTNGCDADTALVPEAEESSSPSNTDADAAGRQIDLLLSVLGTQADAELAPPQDATNPVQSSDDSDDDELEPNIPLERIEDGELRDAYLDDANRCLASLEQLILDAEATGNQGDLAQAICRELHTLKGASASVGFGQLASYIHQAEDAVESTRLKNQAVDCDSILKVVDNVRRQIAAIMPKGAATVELGEPSSATRTAIPAEAGSPVPVIDEQQGSVRVRASKLDRLLDMLAELVVLRNRRQTRVGQLNARHLEMMHCARRLRQFADQMDESRSLTLSAPASGSNPNRVNPVLGLERVSSRSIGEVANDLAELARELGDVYQPIQEENRSLSYCIRQFRQELMQLRRLPVSGLMQRLKRAARDAARVESKSVEIELHGQHVALDQVLHEKLYEPLLHIVRNAVSHGIEEASVRVAKGKPASGRVTIAIESGANLVSVKIRDDGRGLDYEALRRKGVERGLLSSSRIPSNQEIAALIFHPGFSTREKASEISGRGVGMDVVAKAIERLQGLIDVHSTTGQGTTIKLSIPQPTGIEHTMIFRVAGQLYALPLHAVGSAQKSFNRGERPEIDGPLNTISLAKVLGRPAAGQATDRSLRLDVSAVEGAAHPELVLTVDEIVGPEEVVVRGLPKTLHGHPCVSGLTLSGDNEVVLILNPHRLASRCLALSKTGCAGEFMESIQPLREPVQKPQILVVDDSLSARMNLVKRLQRREFEVLEAGDGLEALERMRCARVQLVLTDLDMPRLGGLELLSELKQLYPDLPVVVVSSRSEADVRQRAQRFGAKAFLAKPVPDESLDELVQKFMCLPASSLD